MVKKLPLVFLNSEEQIVPCFCLPLMVPNSEPSIEIIYKVVVNWESGYPLIGCERKSGMITHYNSSFVTELNLNPDLVYEAIRGNSTHSKEIMAQLDLGNSEVTEKILGKGTVKCAISSRIVQLADKEKSPNLEVSLMQGFESHDYLILKLINVLTFQKLNTQTKKSNRKRSNILKYSKLESVEELRQSFMMDLEEKEINLEKFSRDNLAACIAKLFVFLMVLCFLEMAGAFWIIENMHASEVEYMRIFSKKQGEYQNLYSGFVSANLYHQVRSQEEFLRQQGFQTTQLKQKFTNLTFDSIRKFQIDYLTVTLTAEPIQYDLEFGRFAVKTDSSKTNLIDYSQNLGTFKLNKSMEFFARNY